MGLNWIAAHEMEVLLLPEDAANHEGLLSRQKSVITSLYEIATAYGKNSPACIGGTRDFIGCALGGQHALVMASEKKVLTKEQEQTLATSILGKSLKLLSRENLPSYWEVLRYLCFAESSLQKNYSDFIAKQKEGFLKRCAVEGISEEIANNVFLVVENTDDAIYPIHYHPDSTRLCRLFLAMEANQLEQFSGDIALETVLEEQKI